MQAYLRPFHYMLLCIEVLMASTCSGEALSLRSPDGNIRFVFQLTDSCPVYSVWYGSTSFIVASPLSLVFGESGSNPSSSVFGPGLHALEPIYREGRDEYTLPVGKNSS